MKIFSKMKFSLTISKILKKHFSNAKILVINNKKDYAKARQIQGTNKDYEFSGYLELSNCFSSSGPYLIFNDTLFTSHFTKGWIWLICKFILVNNNCKNYIYGDLRFDGTKYEERPNPFLASWLFVIPNYETLKKFQFNLKYSLDNRLISTSKGYEEFLKTMSELHTQNKKILDIDFKSKKLEEMFLSLTKGKLRD